jgi:hypothetical protein
VENTNKFYLNRYVSQGGILIREFRGVDYDFFTSRDDDKLRLTAEECGVANSIVVRGRVQGGVNWSNLKTLTGAGSILVNVSTYDEVQIEVTNLDAPSGRFKLIASGFSIAGGDLQVSAPFGVTSEGTTELTFTSNDSTVVITTDEDGGVDFSVTATSGANFKPEQVRTLDAGDISTKAIILNSIPANAAITQLFVAGAPMQVYGQDFTVTDDVLSWDSLGLDGELQVGDKLVIMYN